MHKVFKVVIECVDQGTAEYYQDSVFVDQDPQNGKDENVISSKIIIEYQ